MTKPRPKPIQAGPRSVVATLTVAEPLVPAEALEQEREPERAEQRAERPRRRAHLDREQDADEARVAGDADRPQGLRHRVELVQRDDTGDEHEREQPPVAEPERARGRAAARSAATSRREARFVSDGCGRGVGRGAILVGCGWSVIGHRPPKRRRRLAYSASACCRSRGPKSGQSLSTKASSAYASCQSRKFETRSSPDVRMSRSGIGQLGRVEVGGEHVLVDLVRVDPALDDAAARPRRARRGRRSRTRPRGSAGSSARSGPPSPPSAAAAPRARGRGGR